MISKQVKTVAMALTVVFYFAGELSYASVYVTDVISAPIVMGTDVIDTPRGP